MDYKKKTIELIKEEFQFAKQRKLEERDYLKEWSDNPEKYVCVFGAGSGGFAVYSAYRKFGLNIDFFCDNNSAKWGTKVWGDIPCISPETLLEYRDNVVVVIAAGTKILEDIYQQLLDMGMPNIVKHCESQLFMELLQDTSDFDIPSEIVAEKMQVVMDMLEDELSQKVLYYKFLYLSSKREQMNEIDFGDVFTPHQYFIENGKYLDKGDCIIDCGSFDGDTLRYLMEQIGYQDFERYVCYELDPDTFGCLQKNVEQYPEDMKKRIEIRPYGVGGGNTRICLDEATGKYGNVVALDDMEQGNKVTFLKMDIEGAEMDTLHGAKRILQEQKPQCAICVYHKISDMWMIPLFLHEMLPEYQIIFRHHQYSWSETVCYAVRRL